MRCLRVSLKVEVRAGLAIAEVCNDLCELAHRLGCTVECDVNDRLLMVYPGDEALALYEAYQEIAKTECRIVTAALSRTE